MILNLVVVEELIKKTLGHPVKITGTNDLHGGDINRAMRLLTDSGAFFIKFNDKLKYPEMFELEAKGLHLLKNAKSIAVPEVIATGEDEAISFLILSFIERGDRGKNFFREFGHSLSNLHRYSAGQFGLNADNYIGSLKQSNRQTDSWIDFFQHERLEPLVKKAFDSELISGQLIQRFEKFYKQCASIFPEENPSLLHGDLWSGNFSSDEKGNPVIFDPAVYFGFREMDLAMTRLFGGFDSDFYESYHDHFPLEKNWVQRMDYCNLYPLLVHLNLFGRSYLPQIENTLRKF